jgi:hypothetical protein
LNGNSYDLVMAKAMTHGIELVKTEKLTE